MDNKSLLRLIGWGQQVRKIAETSSFLVQGLDYGRMDTQSLLRLIGWGR